MVILLITLVYSANLQLGLQLLVTLHGVVVLLLL